MLLISVPVKDRLNLDAAGTPVRINGHATVLRRVGEYLRYEDEDCMENRCLILDDFEDDDLIHFTAASHGEEDSPHTIVRPVARSADATHMIREAPMFQRTCPDTNGIMWVIVTCLVEGAAGEDAIVDYLIGQVALESKASGSALSERFLMRLQGIISEEIVVTLSDRFGHRLRDLCAEKQPNWKQIGF